MRHEWTVQRGMGAMGWRACGRRMCARPACGQVLHRLNQPMLTPMLSCARSSQRMRRCSPRPTCGAPPVEITKPTRSAWPWAAAMRSTASSSACRSAPQHAPQSPQFPQWAGPPQRPSRRSSCRASQTSRIASRSPRRARSTKASGAALAAAQRARTPRQAPANARLASTRLLHAAASSTRSSSCDRQQRCSWPLGGPPAARGRQAWAGVGRVRWCCERCAARVRAAVVRQGVRLGVAQAGRLRYVLLTTHALCVRFVVLHPSRLRPDLELSFESTAFKGTIARMYAKMASRYYIIFVCPGISPLLVRGCDNGTARVQHSAPWTARSCCLAAHVLSDCAQAGLAWWNEHDILIPYSRNANCASPRLHCVHVAKADGRPCHSAGRQFTHGG